MGQIDQVIESASEKLLEDERLRSNMTDRESKMVMDWALGWMETKINAARDETGAKRVAQRELSRVRGMLSVINGLAKQSAVPVLSDSVHALEPALKRGRDFTREEVFYLLIALANAAWRARTDKTRPGRLLPTRNRRGR